MTTPLQVPLPVVAEVVRSGFVEAVHCGSLVTISSDGGVLHAIGDVTSPVFPRSCNKPLQAAAMVRAGLSLEAAQLAVVAASHSGTPAHIKVVESILTSAGLTEKALANATGLPLDEESMRAYLAAGGVPDRLHHNCSGKHAGMVATCVVAGWPVDGYLAPDHPLQRAIYATVEELSGEQIAAVGVDGCGAPLLSVSLTGLARSFASLVRAPAGTPEHRVAMAMRARPDMVGGPGRVVTELMDAVPGLLVKDGAEGAFAAALQDGSAVALKIADGASRAAAPLLVAGLRSLGVHAPALDERQTTPVLGGGVVVGDVRVVAGLI